MKKIGQNFLTNKEKLQEIVEVLSPKPGELIIEIGPGHGELTEELRIKNNESRIIAIEKDENLAQSLKKKFAQDKNIEIVKGDALKMLPSIIHNSLFKIQNYKIIGNIPYYITGYLLRIIGELENKPSLVVLTVQKEVAERICAESSKMNLLAASVQFWAEPKIVDYIPKTDFQPQPKVDSAIIKLTTNSLQLKTSEVQNYYKLIKLLFKQPRKTIFNNLRETNRPKEEIVKILEAQKINPGDRPQNLSVKQIKDLSAYLSQFLKESKQ